MMKDITIVILAGGKSSRIGQDKGLISVNGKPMVQHLIDIAKVLKLNTIIIANNSDYESFNIPVYEDDYKEIGPLGGIHAGFKNTQTSKIFVLSCDTPFITAGLIKYIIEASNLYDITIPRHGSKTHPLIGIYTRDTVKPLLNTISHKKLKVMTLIDNLNSSIVDVTELFSSEIFENINTQKDLYAKVQLKSFGIISDRINKVDMTLSIPNKKQVNLRNYFNDKWPFLKDISYTIAIDQEIREELNKNEHPNEIAILPPFAGG